MHKLCACLMMASLAAPCAAMEPAHAPSAATASAASVAATPPRRAQAMWRSFEQSFDSYMRETKTVGGAAWLIINGKVVSKHANGFADLATKQPIDDDTIYHYASITKTLTAITIFQLRDRGLLKLDDPVVHYVPELAQLHNQYGPVDQVTIRMLLDHSSGLQNPTWPWKTGAAWEPFEPTRWEQLVAMMPYQSLQFTPGSKYSYSNPAYIYLARVVEKLTGESWLTYVQKNVFAPLGMTRSYFGTTPWYLAAHRSNNYAVKDGEPVTNGRDFDPGITIANGGWNAPLGDVAKYVAFLTGSDGGNAALRSRHDALLSRASLNEMWQPQLSTGRRHAGETADDQMALGFFLRPRSGVMLIGHSGSQAGFLSLLYFDPVTKAAVIVAFNTAGGDPGGEHFKALNEALYGVLLSKHFR